MYLALTSCLLVTAQKPIDQKTTNDVTENIYLPANDYISVSSEKKLNKNSSIYWQYVGSNPNIDLEVFVMEPEEFQKFEVDQGTGVKFMIDDNHYINSGLYLTPFRAQWIFVIFNNDADEMGINLYYNVTYVNQPLNHWVFTGPAIAVGVIGIGLAIFFYARHRKKNDLPFFPKREKKEKEEKIKVEKTTRTFRPPLTNFFRMLSVFGYTTISNSCIFGCCCCFCNIAFYLILGVVIFPFWLLFRLFIYIYFTWFSAVRRPYHSILFKLIK